MLFVFKIRITENNWSYLLLKMTKNSRLRNKLYLDTQVSQHFFLSISTIFLLWFQHSYFVNFVNSKSRMSFIYITAARQANSIEESATSSYETKTSFAKEASEIFNIPCSKVDFLRFWIWKVPPKGRFQYRLHRPKYCRNQFISFVSINQIWLKQKQKSC